MVNEFNIQLDPNTQSGLLVYVRIKAPGGEIIGGPVELAEVNEETAFYSGNMDVELGLSSGTYIIVFYNNDGNGVLGVGELHWNGSREITLIDIEIIRKALMNRMKVDEDTNQLIIYEDDGATELQRFNLFDLNGVPTSTTIFEVTNA